MTPPDLTQPQRLDLRQSTTRVQWRAVFTCPTHGDKVRSLRDDNEARARDYMHIYPSGYAVCMQSVGPVVGHGWERSSGKICGQRIPVTLERAEWVSAGWQPA